MATFERQIDALGGTQNETTECGAGYSDGHSRAIEDASRVGTSADALVDELLETIVDALDGRQSLDKWGPYARALVIRVKQRRAE